MQHCYLLYTHVHADEHIRVIQGSVSCQKTLWCMKDNLTGCTESTTSQLVGDQLNTQATAARVDASSFFLDKPSGSAILEPATTLDKLELYTTFPPKQSSKPSTKKRSCRDNWKILIKEAFLCPWLSVDSWGKKSWGFATENCVRWVAPFKVI